MKRIVNAVAAFLLVFCCIVQAGADVIFEPRDSFYESHREQCEYHDRSYTANGPNGAVKVYESPISDSVRATVDNGEELYISFLYTDEEGRTWGHTERWDSDVAGWVPMDYLLLIYDEISFMEDYGDTFLEEEGSLGAEFAGQTVYIWEYPGSTSAYQITVDGGYLPGYQAVYVDANGNRWGRVGYYMAMRGWINLDAPGADFDTLYPNGLEEEQKPEQTPVTEQPSEDPAVEIVPHAPKSMLVVVAVTAAAIVVVVAVTVALLVVLLRKK